MKERRGYLPGVRAWWLYLPDPECEREGGPAYGPLPILRAAVAHSFFPGPRAWNEHPPVGQHEERETAEDWGYHAIRADLDNAGELLRSYLRGMGGALDPDELDAPKVWGMVSGFGVCRIHEQGYRAQGLRVDKLWVLPWRGIVQRHPEWIEGLSDRYRCDVVAVHTQDMLPTGRMVGGA